MANEKRLIDANALSKSIKEGSGTELQKFFADVCVATAPTVDAVEVVYGRWIPNFEYDFDRGEHRLTGYHCDKCGIWTLKKSNYCPNCGAKMDGEGNG